MHLSPIVCHSMTPMIGARVRCVRGRHMLAGASERARSVREHDKARMSLHLRGRSRRELLSAPPCASHVHDFSPAFSMTFPIPQVISREFGEQHRHVMHESCCTHHEKHHRVLEAVMTAFCVHFWCNTAILSGDNFCAMCVISREFGREHRHMMHESCFTHREQHHGVLSSENSPELSRNHSNMTDIVPPSGQNCSAPPNDAQNKHS